MASRRYDRSRLSPIAIRVREGELRYDAATGNLGFRNGSETWRSDLEGGLCALLLVALMRSHPEPASRDELAARAEYPLLGEADIDRLAEYVNNALPGPVRVRARDGRYLLS